ncbi:gamma-glutamyltranspeptidase [Violaceomyces palustris]|uniref:Gamma-glutamyltranspeptidase n=1 Tax=Violaceomyces palustris TaxID=1673888 RepID=A0ACD0P462_9BASI|nr:gamma-glutamyltranspeptidase [Violaceomyces palustris]
MKAPLALALLPLVQLLPNLVHSLPTDQQDGPLSSRSDFDRFRNAPSQGGSPEYSLTGRHGAVATEVDVCSNIGVQLLEQGGSAADAIIGASLCVGSIAAFHSGIGGGGFGLLRTKSGEYEMFDFRETMPALGNETMYSNNSNPKASTVGGLAVGVPGELRAWEALHKRYGKLPWKTLFRPAIDLNSKGFKVPNQLASGLNTKSYPYICTDPYFKEVYCPNGTAKAEGETIYRKRYARTLKTISEEGADAFYEGEIATNTVAMVQARGGILSLEDLKNYTVVYRSPNNITFGGSRVFAGVAPCSGNAVLSTLKTMSLFGPEDAGLNLTTHRIVEATKFAYGERGHYGDPAFVDGVEQLQKEYLGEAYTEEKRSKIKDGSVEAVSYYDPTNSQVLQDSGTSQLTVVDSEGMAITLTTTINTFWGSTVMTPDGIILNNEMDDFSSPGSSNSYGLVPTEANFIRPGKRPLSSISPVIVEDLETKELRLATGSAGGSRIITAVIQNTFGVLHSNFTTDLQTVIDRPRWHDQLQPNLTSFEWATPSIPGFEGFDNSTVAYLASLGHNVSWVAPGQSTAQGVQIFKNGTLLAATEIRQLSARGAAY